MPFSSPPETYGRVIQYGKKKLQLDILRLSMQSVCAGLWIGVFGHCCMVMGAPFYAKDNPITSAVSKLIYATIFPGALLAIVITGTELFTGNTMTMIMCIMDGKATVLELLRVWIVSLLGNFIGVTIMGGLSLATGVFSHGSPRIYLESIAQYKTSNSFGAVLTLGIMCNCMVCLGLWGAVCSDEIVSKAIATWFPIAAFAGGGLEHVIANGYTLITAIMSRVNVTFGGVILQNLIPSLLGNMIGGCIFTGLVWWYAFHPPSSPLDMCSEKTLVGALASRAFGSKSAIVFNDNERIGFDSSRKPSMVSEIIKDMSKY